MIEMLSVVLLQLLLVTLSGSTQLEVDGSCNEVILMTFNAVKTVAYFDRATGALGSLTPGTDLSNAFAITVDPYNGLVFFTDTAQNTIWIMNISAPTESRIIRTLGADATPSGIAVDPILRQVFYTDAGEKVIARMNYDGSDYEVILDSSDNLDQVTAITIDPKTRTLYYANVVSSSLNESYIAKCDYNGEDVIVLQDKGIIFPTALLLDAESDKLYWSGTYYISEMYTNGTGRRKLFEQQIFGGWFSSLILSNNQLIVVDRIKRGLYLLVLGDRRSMIVIRSFEEVPNAIAYACLPTSIPQYDATPAPRPVQTTSEPSSGGDGGVDIAFIIVPVVLVAFAVPFTIGFLCCCIRKRKRPRRSHSQNHYIDQASRSHSQNHYIDQASSNHVHVRPIVTSPQSTEGSRPGHSSSVSQSERPSLDIASTASKSSSVVKHKKEPKQIVPNEKPYQKLSKKRHKGKRDETNVNNHTYAGIQPQPEGTKTSQAKPIDNGQYLSVTSLGDLSGSRTNNAWSQLDNGDYLHPVPTHKNDKHNDNASVCGSNAYMFINDGDMV